MSVIYDAAAHMRGRHVDLERKYTRRGHKIRIWRLEDGEVITIIEKLPPQGHFTKLLTGFKNQREARERVVEELRNVAP